jgi:hypothetical protein
MLNATRLVSDSRVLRCFVSVGVFVNDHVFKRNEVQLGTIELGMLLAIFANIASQDLELVKSGLVLIPEKTEVNVVHLRLLQGSDQIVV